MGGLGESAEKRDRKQEKFLPKNSIFLSKIPPSSLGFEAMETFLK